MLSVIPVLLLGTKYVLDKRTHDKVQMENGGIEYYKTSAKEAALAVAENWNPGLTLTQQKDAAYKVADAVYNTAVGYNLSIVNQAVQGLDLRHWKKVEGNFGIFEPLKIEATDVATIRPNVSTRVVDYENKPNYINRRHYSRSSSNQATWNPNYALWRSTDVNTAPQYRYSVYDEIDESELEKGRFVLKHHDIYAMPSLAYIGDTCKIYNGTYFPNNSYHSPSCHSNHSYFVITARSTGTENAEYSPNHEFSTLSVGNYSSANSIYKSRIASDYVKVSIDSSKDAIKVQTDNDIAYAKPAECNVDIVLAIPVNGAASNADNRDAASDTAGTPVSGVTATTSIPSTITNTPIHQMGQACKSFVKEFYHTKGVTMGLIPYSGKVSLSPDKAVGYTAAIPAFVEPSINPRMMIGACLYSTNGEKDQKLAQANKTTSLVTNQTLPTTDTPYYWGGMLTGCPIMSRRGENHVGYRYGNLPIAQGNLTSTANPTSVDTKYRRMNLCPCYGGYANMLSMSCERECTHYLPNPYYLIEPTADLVKIYEMCNALYPVYDTKNVSNFLFIPFEWTRNFFQSWTNNPSASASSDQLSRPSKTTSGRKKVLILLVNKPDWFEPGELTYLGFDNDISEIPMVESDKIDFSINYSDTSKKFLDGTSYNGTIAGPKKILRISKVSGSDLTYNNGYYEAKGTYRLKFPRKGLVKLKVAQPKTYTGSITFYTDNIGSTYDVRKDSTSGAEITLGTAQTVTGSQTFVFSGTDLLNTVTSNCDYSIGNCRTHGKNFSHNLSVYKVRYSLSNATITNCILKNQVIRYYGGVYGRQASAYNSTRKLPLILNTGQTDNRTSYYSRYSNGNNISDPYPEYKDSCVNFITTAKYWCCEPGVSTFTTRIYGIKKATNFINCYCCNAGIFYLISGNVEKDLGTQTSCSTHNANISSYTSYYANDTDPSVQFRIGEGCFASMGFMVKNYYDKEFISNITDTDLEYNRGVGLKKLTSAINTIPAGNWICFQGDGELHVTVQPATSYVKINGSKTTITSTSQTVTVPSSAFTKEHGRWVATIYFYNAFLKSATQNAGTRVIDTIDSILNSSLIYCYENFDQTVGVKFCAGLSYDESKGKFYADLPFGSVAKYAAISINQLTSSQIESIDLTVNRSTGSNGTLTCYYRSGTETKTISASTTFNTPRTSMNIDGNGSYYVEFKLSNVDVVSAKFFYKQELVFPYDMWRTQILDWRNSTVSTAGTNIVLSGNYSNYNSSAGYHLLNTSLCNPTAKITSFVADISMAFGGESTLFTKLYLPDYDYNTGSTADTYFSGSMVRLFSPLTRDSARKYCQILPYSASYNNYASMMGHSFTRNYNSTLVLNKYQGESDTPTQAVVKATADVCAKLKSDYDSNLRVYVIKYRKQAQYKSFPYYGVTQSNENHDYSYLNNCATGTSAPYMYDVSSKDALETALKAIADDIKSSSFANYTAAKNVN